MLATLPAAMFISGGLGVALGITSLVGLTFKDAAFWKSGGHHYKEQDKFEKDNDMTEGGVISGQYYLDQKKKQAAAAAVNTGATPSNVAVLPKGVTK